MPRIQTMTDHRGETNQDLVSGIMPIGIVDALE